jgi:glycosyltransferase involved in cell wall biosynthesis
MASEPVLSIIVVVYDMQREAPRTLHSLSGAYQEGVREDQYEVLVIENGSRAPLSEAQVLGLRSNFRYTYLTDAQPSPVKAINLGIQMAQGRYLGYMIDGARIATPGLIRNALLGLGMFPRPIVATLGWHLGSEVQRKAVRRGYNQDVEDGLLKQIGWPDAGYDLFRIGTLAESSSLGFFLRIVESNAIFLPRSMTDELGGYDERFDMPGGGLANLDFYTRACELPDSELVVLLGEGTFHQVHGGIATNASGGSEYRDRAFSQYRSIRGRHFRSPDKEAMYLGHVPRQSLPSMLESVKKALPGKRSPGWITALTSRLKRQEFVF